MLTPATALCTYLYVCAEFYGLDTEMFRKALLVLQDQGLAQVLGDGNEDDGVKFLL